MRTTRDDLAVFSLQKNLVWRWQEYRTGQQQHDDCHGGRCDKTVVFGLINGAETEVFL